MKYTQYFHLKKPDEEDPVKIGDLNDNMDIVEAEIRKRPEKAALSSLTKRLQRDFFKVSRNGSLWTVQVAPPYKFRA